MLTLKICVGVFSRIFKARVLKLGIHMDNELLYYGIENHTPCSYSSLYLSIFYPGFFVFVYRLFRICVTVFFATYFLLLLSILFYPITLGRCRGTTDEFATIPFHLDLFSAALVELAKSIPVHSLILSSHLFFCLPLFLFPFTVPCRIVFAKPEDLGSFYIAVLY